MAHATRRDSDATRRDSRKSVRAGRDEDRFGLEYDLDVYNIVAVSDFNMGGARAPPFAPFTPRTAAR